RRMARVRDPAGYDGQREMILSHAAQLFAQRGYAGTSMNEVAAEMQRRGVQAVVTEDLDGEGAVRLTVPDPSLRDFVYGVRSTRRAVPTFMVRDAASEGEHRHVHEPITFFEDGRLGHDIQYLRSEEVIADLLRHSERSLSLSADQRTHLLNRAPGHS
ncbi:TetR family transcriptional regulator, partial [Burkholderia sola]|uniref:TetR family transcriptional regulator n=1 Tax=Burkholderia sola TaxID=2843302 RepID=UPI00338DCD2B